MVNGSNVKWKVNEERVGICSETEQIVVKLGIF